MVVPDPVFHNERAKLQAFMQATGLPVAYGWREHVVLGACDISKDKGERFATVITAALAIWNVGIAFVVG